MILQKTSDENEINLLSRQAFIFGMTVVLNDVRVADG